MIINLSKDEFVDYMGVLENYFWREKHLADILGVDELYGMTELMDMSVGMLAEPFEEMLVENPESEGMNLLLHFCWAMEFGANGNNPIIDGQTYEVSSAGDLYDLLIQLEERTLIRMIKETYTTTDYGCDPTDTMRQSGCYMD